MKKSQTHTLEKFIESNKSLLTAFGVFTAVTTFASNLTIKPIGAILSFIFLSLSILIWLELWAKFPNGKSTWKLDTFENLLSLGTFVLIFYWLTDYRNLWEIIMPFFIFIILINLISNLIKKYNIFNKLFRTKPNKFKILRYITGILLIFIILYTSLTISTLISPHLNNFFDLFHSTYIET